MSENLKQELGKKQNKREKKLKLLVNKRVKLAT